MEQTVPVKESVEQVISRVCEQVRILVEVDQRQKAAEVEIRQAALAVSKFIVSIIPKSIDSPFGVKYWSGYVTSDLDLNLPRYLVELRPIGGCTHFTDIDSIDCAAARRLGFAICHGLLEKIAEMVQAETPKYEESGQILKAALPQQ